MADWFMKCNYCQTSKPDLRRCTRCYIAYYCSKDCQSLDWTLHSKSCNKRDDQLSEHVTSPSSTNNRSREKHDKVSGFELTTGIKKQGILKHKKEKAKRKAKQYTGVCTFCNKNGCTLKCAHCMDIFYCSKKCQRIDWSVHKANCNKNFKKKILANNADCVTVKTSIIQDRSEVNAPAAVSKDHGENNTHGNNTECEEAGPCEHKTDGGTIQNASSQPADGVCRICKTSGVQKRCSKCKLVSYCSKACQMHDWAQHKTFCKKYSNEGNGESKPKQIEEIVFTDDEKRVVEERNTRHQCREFENKTSVDHLHNFAGLWTWHDLLTPEQMRIFKRAPIGSLELATRYAKQRLPTFTVIEKFADIPSEYNPFVTYCRPFLTEVLVAFIFMYHDHTKRHGVYLKDVNDKITHVEFYFDHLEDDPTPYFTYDQVKPGNYILIKKPVMHIFMDGNTGMRINNPSEVMIYDAVS